MSDWEIGRISMWLLVDTSINQKIKISTVLIQKCCNNNPVFKNKSDKGIEKKHKEICF